PLGIGFAWCPGGPAAPSLTEEIGTLPDAVKRAGNFRALFFRGRFDKKYDTMDSIRLTREGWHRSIYSMGSNFSIEMDLNEPSEKLLGRLSKNWKRNLKLAKRYDVRIQREFNPDASELRAMYAEMENLKGLGVLCTEEKLAELFRGNHSNILYLACRDAANKLLGFRCSLIQGRCGVDYLSATTIEGRDARVSFPVLWELLDQCRKIGVTSYDLGGIDPIDNGGVYRFKKGLGGSPVEFLGEWDWASSGWLRLAGNLFLARKQALKVKAPRKTLHKRIFSDIYYAAAKVFNSQS
ncbi:MAG: peptidoglycan bridge formation glycyltransferase FemA/FemB family protein, partial [Acidobacteriota bacterium]|nr:peptidoglycan bridge formation glycyltransferase FemA/FemB family protein [Acidobacteriota bacterium]